MKQKKPPRYRTLAETNALVTKYRGMPKWKYMVRRGWTQLLSAAILSFMVVTGAYEWWLRLMLLLLAVLNAFVFARWESSWEHWQTLAPPTVAQAEQLRDRIRQQADDPAGDPFDRQMMYEVAKSLDDWIKGEG